MFRFVLKRFIFFSSFVANHFLLHLFVCFKYWKGMRMGMARSRLPDFFWRMVLSAYVFLLLRKEKSCATQVFQDQLFWSVRDWFWLVIIFNVFYDFCAVSILYRWDRVNFNFPFILTFSYKLVLVFYDLIIFFFHVYFECFTLVFDSSSFSDWYSNIIFCSLLIISFGFTCRICSLWIFSLLSIYFRWSDLNVLI